MEIKSERLEPFAFCGARLHSGDPHRITLSSKFLSNQTMRCESNGQPLSFATIVKQTRALTK